MLLFILVFLIACTPLLADVIIKTSGKMPRNKWLSFSGGVSVSYVIMYLLPELQEYKNIHEINQEIDFKLPPDIIFLCVLSGFTLFYGLEHLIHSDLTKSDPKTETTRIFYIHVAAFAVYNIIIGCFMAEERDDTSVPEQLIFTLALIFHFLGNGLALNTLHKDKYKKIGKWILALSVIVGFLLNYLLDIPYAWIIISLSFVAGAIMLNSFKDELPETNKAKFRYFFLGVLIYTVLLYLIK
jgi:uncharacterized membrane protein YidH (DUF202 family)